jgi:hypothetical protein
MEVLNGSFVSLEEKRVGNYPPSFLTANRKHSLDQGCQIFLQIPKWGKHAK